MVCKGGIKMQFMSNKIMKVAIYCRVSTDKSDQANSLESQQKYFKEYIERNPMWELYDIYVDEGISGTNTKKRKAFNTMMVDAQLKKFDLIITKEISRFARNTLDSIYYTRELKRIGVGVLFANDNLCTLDADAELRLTIMSSIAQEESRKTSERVKWGQKRRMEQGVVFGNDLLGYDLRNGELHVNPTGARVVKKIFHKYVVEHKGTSTIARELKEEGEKTLNNNPWSNTVILRALRNEKYCGDLIQKKTITTDYLEHTKEVNDGIKEEFVIIRDHHEPIISRELFDQAQQELRKRSMPDERKTKLGRRYCFSGKIKCGECGNSFVYHNKKLMSGNRYKYWLCYNKKKNGKTKRIDTLTELEIGCPSFNLGDEYLKEVMYEIIDTLQIRKDSVISTMRKQLKEVFSDTEIEDYETKREKIKTLRNKRDGLVDLYLDQTITKEEFKKKSAELDELLEKMVTELNDISSITTVKKDVRLVVKECLEYASEVIDNARRDEEFIKDILEEMVVYLDKTIVIKLNLIPSSWKYAVEMASQSSNQGLDMSEDHFVTEVPTSVKRPLSSG